MTEDVNGDHKPIPKTLICVFAIECDSISDLNGRRAENRDCAGNPDYGSRTGDAARSRIRFLEANAPPMFLPEQAKRFRAKSPTAGRSHLNVLIEKVD